GTPPPAAIPSRAVLEWSRKSRARMVRTFCELDYAPLTSGTRVPCVITLTLPGDWQAVAPDGAAFKRLTATFQRRWRRAWGEPLPRVGEAELPGAGAPPPHWFPPPPPPPPRRPAGPPPQCPAPPTPQATACRCPAASPPSGPPSPTPRPPPSVPATKPRAPA